MGFCNASTLVFKLDVRIKSQKGALTKISALLTKLPLSGLLYSKIYSNATPNSTIKTMHRVSQSAKRSTEKA